MDLTKRRTVPFRDVKSEGDGSTFSGYCAAFHNCDSYGDVITASAFNDWVKDFADNGQILYDHYELIGRPLEASIDPKGLFVKGAISDTARGKDTKILLKDGVLRKMSIGYQAMAYRPTNQDEVKAYWQSVGYTPNAEDLMNLDQRKNTLCFLTSVRVLEASPVAFPANTSADITEVKSGLWRLSGVKALLAELDLEKKAGRTLSRQNREKLLAIHACLMPAAQSLKDLLDATEPNDGDDDDEDPKAAKARLAKARNELTLLNCDPLLDF